MALNTTEIKLLQSNSNLSISGEISVEKNKGVSYDQT